MNKSTITKTVAKAKTFKGPESEAFKKYLALPNRVAKKLQMHHFLNESTTFVEFIRSLFGGMTDDQFAGWLALN